MPEVPDFGGSVESLVVLTKSEEEYLLRTLEESLGVRRLQQFFLWTQGQFQGVLPHGIMVCVKFSESGEVERVECLRRMLCDLRVLNRLCESSEGLVVRMARYCRTREIQPSIVTAVDQDEQHPMSRFHAELESCGLSSAMIHGTDSLSGGATFFALLSMPDVPTARHAFILNLLLPALHLAFLRVVADRGDDVAKRKSPLSEPLTQREKDVLQWVCKGKTNHEIGLILDLSALTIRNHMQKIFKKLSVNNRMQAALRSRQWRLLDSDSE